MIREIQNINKFQLYIGMEDKEKMQQLCPTEDFIKIISNICSNSKIEFTMGEVYGGYISQTGEFLCENSLVLSVIGASKEEIFKLAEELKKKLNQHSIVISVEQPEIFISE